MNVPASLQLADVAIRSGCKGQTAWTARVTLCAQCEKKGIAYIAFSMWIASTFQYCIAFNMLKKPPLQPQSPNKDEVVEDEGQMPVTLVRSACSPMRRISSPEGLGFRVLGSNPTPSLKPLQAPSEVFQSFECYGRTMRVTPVDGNWRSTVCQLWLLIDAEWEIYHPEAGL